MLDEQAQEEEEELREELGLQVVLVVLRQEARDRHTDWDRVSYGRDGIRTWLNRLERGIPGGVELSVRSVLGA